MVHNAFDAVAVVSDCPVRISSLVVWNNRLLLACIDGSLRVYYQREQPDSCSDGDGGLYSLRDTRIAFSRKPITCMHALPACLLSLSDALAVHTLPDFDLQSTPAKTKGASLYSWDPRRSWLAVAVKKRLFVYRLDGAGDFSELKDFSLPDVAKSMVWCGESLCLGIRREYIIVNVITGASIDVFPAGRVAPPLAVALSEHQLLLGKENVGVFVDSNGKLNQQGGISWSEAPGAIVTSGPYALARMTRFIEVRSLRAPHGLVQTIPIREPQLLLSDDAGVFVASEVAVCRLVSVSIAVQLVQLAASGNFEDALALCKLLPSEDTALRIVKEDSIHIRFGYSLFDKGEYVQAMEHFAASSLDLTAILSLFPSIKIPSWVSSPAHTREEAFSNADQTNDADKKTADGQRQLEGKTGFYAYSALSGFLAAKRGAVVGRVEAEETDATVAAIVKITGLKHGSSVDRIGDNQTEIQKKRGPRELAIVLDTALVQAFLATGHSQSVIGILRGPNYCDVATCEEVMVKGGHYSELLELYRSNQKHREALQLLNRLAEDPKSMKSATQNPLRYGPQDIVNYILPIGDKDPSLTLESSTWMLKNEADHALKLLTSIKPPLPTKLVLSHLKAHAPHLQATYLESLLSDHPELASADLQNELVQLYVSRVLVERNELLAEGTWDEREHSSTRQKLLAILENSFDYIPEIVFQQLPSDGLYVEKALLLGKMGQHKLALTLYAHKLHERELALSYCDRVYSSVSSGPRSRTTLFSSSRRQGPNDEEAANVYMTVLEVYLRPETAVTEYDRFTGRVDPLQHTTNPKVGGGHKGKGTVCKKIAQIEGAEDGQSYSSADNAVDSSRSDIDEGPTGSVADGQTLDEALRLLSLRWDRINCAQALRMIPSDTKLQRLLPFLEPLLRKCSETGRNQSVIKSLRSREHIQIREELLQCRKRVVRVTSERTCSICQKRIGSSVFAVYPLGVLAHFVCYRDQQLPNAAGS